MARGLRECVHGPIASRGQTTGEPVKESDRVRAVRISIAPHPDADRLELARVGGYVSVVPKGTYADGQLVVYIPEGMLVPESVLRAIGLWDTDKDKGRLAGADGTRVKAARFRGVLSQGLVYAPADIALTDGEDYAEALGITKWVPPIPTNLDGELIACPSIRSYTDIENLKRFPDALVPGEEVVCVEKNHGSCCVVHYADGQVWVSSKGRAGSGRALRDVRDPQSGESVNAYWRSVHALALTERLPRLAEALGTEQVTLYGETFGVQDLMYGLEKGQVDFRAFDVRVGEEFLDFDEFTALAEAHAIPMLPVLYRGPFSEEAVTAVTSGREQVSGRELHLREGVVVRPTTERYDDALGRVILKSIAPDYLTRKDGTEFN